VAQQFTGRAGKYVPVGDTVRSFARLLAGEVDHVPEQYFSYQGSLDEVITAFEAGK
jgi:F-type H+-transporting ATPase subunit beta